MGVFWINKGEMLMVKKRKILELTQREQDVFKCMLERAIKIEDRLRVCFSPAEIRDVLKKNHMYSKLKDYDVSASQKNLITVGLISPIRDKSKSEPVNGKRKKLSYELNEILYAESEIVTIEKRVGGYPIGTKLPQRENPIDRAKSTIREAEKLIDAEKLELANTLKKLKRSKAISERLEKRAEKSRRIISVINGLLLLKSRNFKSWEKKLKEKPKEITT